MTSYPFSDPDPIKLKEYTDSIYNASIALDIIKEYQSFNIDWSFDILCFTLKYLEETYLLQLNNLIFCDCMGIGLQVATIASTFLFKEVISIELSEDDVNRTIDAIKLSSLNLSSVTIKIGRLQDYFVVDADILYLDCNILGPFLDEGLFLESFFTCSINLKTQSFLILITRHEGYNFEEKGFSVILYQYSKLYSHMWLCQKL